MKFSRRTLRTALAVVAFFSLSYGIFHVFWIESNLRTLAENKVYRSGQPFENDWQELYEEAPFKSVLNLRGERPGKAWYDPEASFIAGNDIRHYNISLSAQQKPDLATMEKMVMIMNEAPKPLLIHCKRGADRSGLASALYEYAIEGKPATEASRQLSLWYGHFCLFNFNETAAMDEAFWEFVRAYPQPIVFLGNQMPQTI